MEENQIPDPVEDGVKEAKEEQEEFGEKPSELCDSITIGSASKGGITKLYGSFDNKEAFKKKIDVAKEVREYAQANIAVNI